MISPNTIWLALRRALAAAALCAAVSAAPAWAQNQQCTNEQLACINRCTSYTDGCIQACNARSAACFNGAGPAAGPSGVDSPLNPFAGAAAPSPFATPAPAGPASPFAAAAPAAAPVQPAPVQQARGQDAASCIAYAQTAGGGLAWRNSCPHRVNLQWRTDNPADACYSASADYACGQMVEASAESALDPIGGNYVMGACRYPGIPAVNTDGSQYCR